MAVNLKNEETTELIHQLAEVTGETLTTAVREAVRQRLERLRAEDGPRRSSEALLEIGRDAARRLDAIAASTDHEMLYGEDGLPR